MPFNWGDAQVGFDLGKGVKLELVLVPAGEFMMGSPDSDRDAYGDEKPRHKVRITRPFYLGKYPVTQEQWESLMGDNPSKFKGPKNPVEQVTWNYCQAFVDKLNAKFANEKGRFALPTEAQWEYACRAGSTARYGFGDDATSFGKYGWYDKNSGDTTHPVGEKQPNAWGLYDMHGNVWAWCQDWFDGAYYARSPTDDPRGPADGSSRVNRGGSRVYPPWICRSASRSKCGPGDRSHDLGLRVSLVLAQKKA
jgi:formylglycine-generating enzyme required for sulfatase activity